MRLTGEIRDEVDNYYRDSLLYEAHGVEVYLYSEDVLIDSCSTDYGSYGFQVSDQGVYSFRTWVVPLVVETAGPVVCADHSCDTPDTLMLGRHGEIHLYPNPFGASVTIAFDLDELSSMLLTVRDIQGQTVKTIAEGFIPPGRHSIRWDGTDSLGVRVASGPYWIILRAGEDHRYLLALVGETG